jgi:hypothetical protein
VTGYDDDSEDTETEDIEEVEPRFPGDDLDIEAWPEPVDGIELLDRLVETFNTYLSLDPGMAEILACGRCVRTPSTHASLHPGCS